MAIFQYQAINNDTGEVMKGKIEADGKNEALSKITSKNLSLFNLDEQVTTTKKKKSLTTLFSNKKKDLIVFTNQLANLLKSGIQLGESLGIVSRLLKESEFKEVVDEVHNSLKGGQNFAEALSSYPKYFSSGYINMIKAGEEGGFLTLTCQRLAKNLEDNNQLKSFVISSLIYPFVLLIVSILAVIVMLVYVLPKFTLIYSNYGKSLPKTTEILLDLSNFMSNYYLIIIISVVLGAIISWRYYCSEKGRKNIDYYLLKIPILDELIRGIEITKISRSIGSMLESGVPLLKSLKVSSHISTNLVIRETLKKAALEVKRGKHLSDSLFETDVFPEIVTYMIGIGEQTGNLGAMLLQVSDNFEEETKKKLDKLMKIFEPLLILIMGFSIGFIIISMILPILGMNNISF